MLLAQATSKSASGLGVNPPKFAAWPKSPGLDLGLPAPHLLHSDANRVWNADAYCWQNSITGKLRGKTRGGKKVKALRNGSQKPQRIKKRPVFLAPAIALGR